MIITNSTFLLFSFQAFEKFNSLLRLELREYNLVHESITEMLRQKTRLVELSLTGSKVFSGINIINNLTNLELLNFDKTQSMTSDGFRVLKTLGTTMKKLRHLAISLYPGVNDHGLEYLSQLKNFETLMINDMERNYQRNFDDVVATFHGLKKLYCANNNNISDFSIKLLFKNLPKLEYLDVCNTRVTIKTLMLAAEFITDRKNDTKLTLVINAARIPFYHDFIDHPGLEIIAK